MSIIGKVELVFEAVYSFIDPGGSNSLPPPLPSKSSLLCMGRDSDNLPDGVAGVDGARCIVMARREE